MKKLTSRKFCSALIGIITGISLLGMGNITEGTALVISSVVGYMLAEGFIDAKAIAIAQEAINNIEKEEKEEEE